MSWSDSMEAIREAVAYCLGLEDETGADGSTTVRRVEWENQRTAFGHTGETWAFLRVTGVEGLGTDEIRYEFEEGLTPALSRVIPSYVGWREVTVAVLIGSESQEHTLAAPTELAGRLRLRLRRPEALDVLQAQTVAIAGIGPAIGADYRDGDGRWVSAAIVDLRFTVSVSETDSTTLGGYIHRIQGEGEGDLAGSTLDTGA